MEIVTYVVVGLLLIIGVVFLSALLTYTVSYSKKAGELNALRAEFKKAKDDGLLE